MVIFITEWGHDFAAVHNVQYMMGPCFLFYFIIFLSYVLADGLWGTLLQQLYFLSETIKQAMRKTNYWRRLNTTNVRSEQQRNSTIRGLERWPLCVRGHRLVFLLILLFFPLYIFSIIRVRVQPSWMFHLWMDIFQAGTTNLLVVYE